MCLLGDVSICVAAAIIACDNSICAGTVIVVVVREVVYIVFILVLRFASVAIMTIGSTVGAFSEELSFGLRILSGLPLFIGLVLLQFALKQLLECHLLAHYGLVRLHECHLT